MKTLVLDFDGVIHSYHSGWNGARVISDEAVPGAISFIISALRQYKVAVLSSRSHRLGGRRAMKEWLKQELIKWFNEEHSKILVREKDCLVESDVLREFYKLCDYHGDFIDPWHLAVTEWANDVIKKISWPIFKPAAFLTIDDRAITFSGSFPSLYDIAEFKPWNK